MEEQFIFIIAVFLLSVLFLTAFDVGFAIYALHQ